MFINERHDVGTAETAGGAASPAQPDMGDEGLNPRAMVFYPRDIDGEESSYVTGGHQVVGHLIPTCLDVLTRVATEVVQRTSAVPTPSRRCTLSPPRELEDGRLGLSWNWWKWPVSFDSVPVCEDIAELLIEETAFDRHPKKPLHPFVQVVLLKWWNESVESRQKALCMS